MIQTHPNAAKILSDFEAWADAANEGRTVAPRTSERERLELELRAKSP
jgi:hypothetical protein